eukprot:SAG22_NODE_56_length_23716_cov_11.146759_9_plen_546_part_00
MYAALESGPSAAVPAAGKSFVFRVELDASTAAGLVFEYFVDGKSQAKWTDADKSHAAAVSGAAVGVRAFDGAVVFHSLKFGTGARAGASSALQGDDGRSSTQHFDGATKSLRAVKTDDDDDADVNGGKLRDTDTDEHERDAGTDAVMDTHKVQAAILAQRPNITRHGTWDLGLVETTPITVGGKLWLFVDSAEQPCGPNGCFPACSAGIPPCSNATGAPTSGAPCCDPADQEGNLRCADRATDRPTAALPLLTAPRSLMCLLCHSLRSHCPQRSGASYPLPCWRLQVYRRLVRRDGGPSVRPRRGARLGVLRRPDRDGLRLRHVLRPAEHLHHQRILEQGEREAASPRLSPSHCLPPRCTKGRHHRCVLGQGRRHAELGPRRGHHRRPGQEGDQEHALELFGRPRVGAPAWPLHAPARQIAVALLLHASSASVSWGLANTDGWLPGACLPACLLHFHTPARRKVNGTFMFVMAFETDLNYWTTRFAVAEVGPFAATSPRPFLASSFPRPACMFLAPFLSVRLVFLPCCRTAPDRGGHLLHARPAG